MSEPTFDERLQSLLAKIYNETYELTFTNTSKTVRIDEGYRPPSSLHVIRYTRKLFYLPCLKSYMVCDADNLY